MQHSKMLDTLQNLTNHKPTQREISEILDVPINTIGARAKRDSNYSTEEIRKIGDYYKVDLFNQISLGWLNKSNNIQEPINSCNSENCVKVIFRPEVYLSAGYGVEVIDEHKEYMCLDERLFFTDRGTKINPANCEVVPISGNSMAPEYRHGDRVIIDKSITYWIDGHIFAFRYKGECYIKEICLMGRRVKAIPLNKEYEPFFIEEDEDIQIFGRIIPRVRL